MEQAKRVPWNRLAAVVDEYTDWQVFSLWIRAMVEAAKSLPAMVVQEMEARSPQLLGHIDADADAIVTTGGALATWVWQEVSEWAEANIFISPKSENWLDAVRYFSAMSLRSLKAWTHWEQTNEQWRLASPEVFPMYAQWETEVAAVTCLSTRDSQAQHLLDCSRDLPESAWNSLRSRFVDLIAFSLWMELVLDIEGSHSQSASKELAKRYSGFSLRGTAIGSKEAVRALNDWAIEHTLGIAGRECMLAALSYSVGHHPSYYPLRNYALHCHDVWRGECPAHPPSFGEWREAADAYFET